MGGQCRRIPVLFHHGIGSRVRLRAVQPEIHHAGLGTAHRLLKTAERRFKAGIDARLYRQIGNDPNTHGYPLLAPAQH